MNHSPECCLCGSSETLTEVYGQIESVTICEECIDSINLENETETKEN